MRRAVWGPAVLGMLMTFAPIVMSAPSALAAAAAPVTAWLEISTTRPAAGCSVNISVEIRTNGDPVAAAGVNAALFSGRSLIDTYSATTDGNGVVELSVDASSGVGDWVDVDVNGAYLTGFSIAAGTGSSCADAPRSMTVSGALPSVASPAGAGSTGSTVADASGDAGPTVNVGGVIFYKQERNLSCEYAALHIATAAWGAPVSEYAFDDVVGWNDNPHRGYRGDITGPWGNTTDYGVYAEPLAAALAQFGFTGDVFYAQGDASALTSRLDAGVPTVVWIAERGDQSEYAETDGASYMLMNFEHVVVAYGYSDAGVYISDPASASSKFFPWDTFMGMWNLMDGMGLGVSPT